MSAVDRALQGLRRLIAEGTLQPGAKLPTEAELAQELGVARGSIREASKMLGALGIIETRRGSGSFVSALGAREIMSGLALTVELIPFEGLLELYEMRKVLEAHATALAASRIGAAAIERLGELVAAMESSADPVEHVRLDREFHQLIAEASGNETLCAFLEVVAARSRTYQIFLLHDGPQLIGESTSSHRAILESLRDRDSTAAHAAAFSHVLQTERWLRTNTPPPGLDPSLAVS